MKKLWEFSEEHQRDLVAAHLIKHGPLIGEMSTPHSSIYTFDHGPHTYPRYVIAKGIQVDTSKSTEEKRKYFDRALFEVNNAYGVFHHGSIHRFFDVDVICGVPFLLSRKRDATLRDVIADGSLPLPEAISIAIQLVHALIYCAQKGIICHQDLKPENVFIDFFHKHFAVPPEFPLRCRIHVADFELANAYLVLRHPYGSRPYMAPEQYGSLREDPLPDFSRTDVFAVGVILFEMLTGGVHPVGERTSLVWPHPAEGKSRKWLREDPWKQWLNRGALTDIGDHSLDPEILLIIQDCLKIDSAMRPSKKDLEVRLLERLRILHEHEFDTLSVMLAQYDQIANESEELGWPYYADRLKRLNDAFSE
jgi:eukaryotic-like serine/threonine-protein kinase